MTVLLFHSAFGLRPAVHAAADLLRSTGHEVIVPDLFDGRTPDTMEEGQKLRDEIGKDELLRRAVVASAPYSERGIVYAGLSMGAALAQNVALGDARARGLLLLHGTSDIADDTVAASGELPVQLHVADPDPFETHDWLNAWYLRMQRAGAEVEVYRYPGAGHLFTDPELDDYDPEAAESMWPVATAFVDEVAAG
ncbi:dienelactone hydrolase family protein [Streptomyces boninensis]|uniref:dienelactone hydrolase family protein n=1 Tax=Streptomyces boninensis TaxID=2039455 RepID=UPI003B22289E